MIEYRSEDQNFLQADDQYLLCIANCVNSKLDKSKEPLTTAIFTKFPEANVYKDRSINMMTGTGRPKPGSLIIKGRVAIILGTIYPGSKEYANDNREFRLKWFREGLMALQKLSPRSIAVRENFSEDFGGDWHKYLFHLTEMDKSIKISIYPYVIAIPIFNIVRFREEDQNHEHESKKSLEKSNTNQSSEDKEVEQIMKKHPNCLGFGIINPVKFGGDPGKETDERPLNPIPLTSTYKDDDANETSTSTSTSTSASASILTSNYKVDTNTNAKRIYPTDAIPIANVPLKTNEMGKKLPLKLPAIRKPILPIKISAEEESSPIIDELSIVEESCQTVNTQHVDNNDTKEGNNLEKGEKKDKEEGEQEKKKSYIANPTWNDIDLNAFTIDGWDEIIKNPILIQKKEAAFNLLLTKELPRFGDFFKIYPPIESIFNAFNLCPFKDIRVVIVGMDPYIHEGEAMGLAFSVSKGVKIPPSLRNIYKELANDIPDFKEPTHGSLEAWARQGVFLINSALTVRQGVSGSHLDAWQPFTDQVISLISQNKNNLVFILWGNPAKKKLNVIKNIDNHYIITAAHPSPLSASKGFFGCKCFSQANNYLLSKNLPTIDWSIP